MHDSLSLNNYVHIADMANAILNVTARGPDPARGVILSGPPSHLSKTNLAKCYYQRNRPLIGTIHINR